MRVRDVMRAKFQRPNTGKCPGIIAATSLRPRPQQPSEARYDVKMIRELFERSRI
jgi:hypothetical protein